MHFFQGLCTTIETRWIESINLGYNARFFATLTKIDKYIKFNNEVEKHTWSRNKNLMDASLWEGNLLQYAWYTSAILKHVKLLGLAEQNHGYLTSLHRIRSDKISDKRRVRKFPTFEMATMLWRHMVIKFDNDPGLITVDWIIFTLVCLWCVRTVGRAGGRCTVTCLPNFLGWVVYHIFLPMVLRYKLGYSDHFVNDIWNKSYMKCRNEMRMKKWSSQWTQFMQSRKYIFSRLMFFSPSSRLPMTYFLDCLLSSWSDEPRLSTFCYCSVLCILMMSWS